MFQLNPFDLGMKGMGQAVLVNRWRELRQLYNGQHNSSTQQPVALHFLIDRYEFDSHDQGNLEITNKGI